MKKLCTGFVFSLFASVVHSADIAITFDDLPYVASADLSLQEGKGIVESVIRTLANHHATAIGFAIGEKITPQTSVLISEFVSAGNTLGNHTWTHPDYNKITVEQFRNEVKKTEQLISPWKMKSKYFRFPYLDQGNSKEKLKKAERVLINMNYQNVSASINNDDFKYNNDYVNALSKDQFSAAKNIGEKYLNHIKERTFHFQRMAQKKFGRDVKHIILLHMNKINADYLNQLLDWYESQGWKFISIQDALTDPIYATSGYYTGSKGVSQLERL